MVVFLEFTGEMSLKLKKWCVYGFHISCVLIPKLITYTRQRIGLFPTLTVCKSLRKEY